MSETPAHPTEPRDFRVGGRLAEQAVSADARTPSEPRLASTVLLVRDGGDGVETFMIRRVPTMEFAPSMWVFPGGGVDPRDADSDLPWAGPSPAQWAGRIGVDEATTRQLVIAAVREVFEECGVLLAGADRGEVLSDVSGAQWHGERESLLAKEQSLAQVLIRRGLTLRSDLLTLRDHWVTPPFEPKRYDTYFFAALLPTGQVADDATTEADLSEWVRSDDLLRRVAAGADRMLPPTVVNLERVGRATSAADFVREQPPVVRVLPQVHRDGRDVLLRAHLPAD